MRPSSTGDAGVDVVVATPGRAVDHLSRGTLRLGEVGVVVLDEADEMLEIGFLDDVKKILSFTPDERQTLHFSATFPHDVLQLAREIADLERRVSGKNQSLGQDFDRVLDAGQETHLFGLVDVPGIADEGSVPVEEHRTDTQPSFSFILLNTWSVK